MKKFEEKIRRDHTDLGQFLLNQTEKSGEIKNSSVRVVDLGMNINITWLWVHWHLDNLFYRIIENISDCECLFLSRTIYSSL